MTDVPIEELLFSGVAWVCIAAWRALPLLCIVLAFDLLLRRRIAARFHCLLWMIVAARMLCPFSVESSFSIHGNLLTALEAVGFSNSQTHAPLDAQNSDFDTYTFQNEPGDAVTVSQPRAAEDLHQDSKFKYSAAYSSPQPDAFVGDAGEPAPLDPEILVIQTRHIDSPSQPVLGVKINNRQARRFVQRSVQDARSSTMLAPEVRVFSGMPARIMSESLRPFVTGMRPPGASNDRSMVPIVEACPEGFRFFVRGDVSDEKQMRIRCAVTLSKLDDVEMANLPINKDDDSGARHRWRAIKAAAETSNC